MNAALVLAVVFFLAASGSLALVTPFRTATLYQTRPRTATPSSSSSRLFSTPDPMDEIRQRMAQDPSYNPMQDPQAMQVMESLLPDELKEVPNSIERLKVALQNAMTGPDAVADLDAAAAGFPNKQDLISTPTSAWFQGGMANDNPSFDAQKKQQLFEKLRSENPDVPAPATN